MTVNTMNLPSMSVVIVVRNGVATLAAQLEALAKQEYSGECEVIIVDNGSTDGTLSLIEARQHLFQNLRVRCDPETSGGPSLARNNGAALASGVFIVFLDHDDVIAPGYLQAMGEMLMECEFAGASMDSNSLNMDWNRDRRAPMQETELARFHGYPFIVGATLGARRGKFLSLGGFDCQLVAQEDIDLSIRALRAGMRLGFVPDAKLTYRYRDTMMGILRQEQSYGKYAVALYCKHSSNLSPRLLRTTVRGWFEVVRYLPFVFNRGARAKFVTALGAATGRLQGSLKYRKMFL